MSVRYTSDDIFTSKAEVIANPVNCVGVSGAGLARQFARRYPENDRLYREACDERRIRPGRGLITETGRERPRYIVNFPTKRHWREKSRIEDIRLGLRNLRQQLLRRGIASVALPALGAGLGGLDWNDVKALIENEFGTEKEITAIICKPRSTR